MGRKKGVMFSILTVLVEVFSTLLLTPILISKFGQSEYGVYMLVLSVASYMALLDLGVGQSVVKFMAKYIAEEREDKQRQFLGIVSLYYLICAIIIVIVGIVLVYVFPVFFSKGLLESEIILAQKLLFLTSFNIAATIGTAGFYYTLISYERYNVSKGMFAGLSVVRIIISITCLLNGAKSLEIVIINLIFTIIFRGIVCWYVLFKLHVYPTIKDVSFIQIKEIVGFSFFVFLQMIATQINNMADQILIGIFARSAAIILAVYAVGAQINQYFQTLSSTINGVLMPGVVKLIEREKASRDLSQVLQEEAVRIGRIIFMMLSIIWVVFLVAGKQFVLLWAGDINEKAYYVALILMLPYVIIESEMIFSQMLWAINKHKQIAILKLMVVVINVFLTIILIRKSPLIGATIGTFISLIIGDIILKQIIFSKELGIDIGRYLKELVKGIGVCLSVSFAVGLIIRCVVDNSIISFLLICGGMVISYVGMLCLYGFSEYEKNLLKGYLTEIKKRS